MVTKPLFFHHTFENNCETMGNRHLLTLQQRTVVDKFIHWNSEKNIENDVMDFLVSLWNIASYQYIFKKTTTHKYTYTYCIIVYATLVVYLQSYIHVYMYFLKLSAHIPFFFFSGCTCSYMKTLVRKWHILSLDFGSRWMYRMVSCILHIYTLSVIYLSNFKTLYSRILTWILFYLLICIFTIFLNNYNQKLQQQKCSSYFRWPLRKPVGAT